MSTPTERMQKLLHAPYARVFYQDANGYGAKVLEWPGCYGAGPTAQAAMDDLEQAMVLWVEAERDAGHDIPQPFAVKATGRISLRVAPTVHARFLTSAAAEGISLNRWIEKSASAAIPEQE